MFVDVNEERSVTIQELAKDGYKYIALIRTSTTEQDENREVQEKDLIDSMERLGFKQQPVLIASENVSGAKAEREQINVIMDFIKSTPEKKRKLIVVARDVARFSRDTQQGLQIQTALQKLGVYLYVQQANLLLNGDGAEQGSNQLIFEILLAMSKSGKRSETIASKTGTREAKKKGLFSGTPQDSYVKLVRTSGSQRGKSIRRRIYESLGGLEAKTIQIKPMAKELSNSAQTFYPAKLRAIRDELKDIEAQGGKKKVEEYLAVWDAIIKEEKKRGVGPRTGKGRMTDRARAIHRVTVAYLQNPFDFPRPDTIGNPLTATIPTPDRTGTIADASANSTLYLPKAR